MTGIETRGKAPFLNSTQTRASDARRKVSYEGHRKARRERQEDLSRRGQGGVKYRRTKARVRARTSGHEAPPTS